MTRRRKTGPERQRWMPGILRSGRGVTLIELLIVITLFALAMAALQQSFSSLVRMGMVREYRAAESEMELGIVKSIISRDFSMAGYGLPQSIDRPLRDAGYRVVAGVEGTNRNDDSDTLILRGTAIGRESRAAQAWSYRAETNTGVMNFREWSDGRERLKQNDAVISMDPYFKKLTSPNNEWIFQYNGQGGDVTTIGGTPMEFKAKGDLFYGFYYNDPGSSPALPVQPYYAVRYYLGGASFPATCAPNTRSLLRAESRTDPTPSGLGSEPILNCVLDFQVALGIDDGNLADIVDEADGKISFWDNGGVAFTAGAAAADAAMAADSRSDQYRKFNKNLKEIRAYVLVQVGNRDPGYFYKNPDPDYAGKPDKIWVGDRSLEGGVVGREVTLTDEQRRYRWRVLTVAVTPRNIW